MNKGVKIAQGEIIGFLNADDFYHSDALKIVNDYFNSKDIDFIWLC